MIETYKSPYKKLLNLYHGQSLTLYIYDVVQDTIYYELVELHKKATQLNINIEDDKIKVENNGKIELHHHKEFVLGGLKKKKLLCKLIEDIIRNYLRDGSFILNFMDEKQSQYSFLKLNFRRIVKSLSSTFKNVTYVVDDKEMFCYENLDRKYTRSIHCIEYFYNLNGKNYCSFIQFKKINVDKLLYDVHKNTLSSRNILEMNNSKDEPVDYLSIILKNIQQNNNYFLLIKDITSNKHFNIYKYYLYVSVLRFLYYDNHEGVIFSLIENLKKSEIKKIIEYVNSISIYEDAYINYEAEIKHVPKCVLKREHLEYDTFKTKFNFFLKNLCNDEYPEIDEIKKFKVLEIIVKYLVDENKQIFEKSSEIFEKYNKEEVKELFEEIFTDIKNKVVYIIILINLRKESQVNRKIDSSSIHKKVFDCFIKTSSYDNEEETIDEIISYKN